MKTHRLFITALALTLIWTLPACAVNKEMVQLQDQVKELQDAVARLQQSNDERMGALKDLVQQTADSVNKMTITVDVLQKTAAEQQVTQGGKLDQISSQIQSMNDSIDELKASIAALNKTMQSIQGQQQSINAAIQNMSTSTAPATPGDSAAPTGAQPETQPATPPPAANGKAGRTLAANPAPLTYVTPAPAISAPPVEQLYQTAYGDFVAGKTALADAEFYDVIKFYPDNNLAGNAHFYIGETLYKQNKFALAAKEYDHVLDQYPGNNKIPASELKKGYSLLSLHQTDAGVRELHSLIQRYPNSPEAVAAKNKLAALASRKTAQ